MDTTEGGTGTPEPEPKIIGLTGGIGSGKTTAAKYIEEAGYPVYYSDIRAKNIVNDNATLKKDITELLGIQAYDKKGIYDKKYVSGIIFSDEEARLKLNSLIHPAVRSDFESWVNLQDSEFIFKETALLFELGLHAECFRSLLITADENIRIKRVMDRDGKTYREVEAIMEKQMPEKDKIKNADYIIYNNASTDELKTHTLEIIQKLKEDIEAL